MRDDDGGPAANATPALVAELTTERDRIDRTVNDLLRSRDVLDQVISTAAGESTSVPQGKERARR